jgi:hypothetical protein
MKYVPEAKPPNVMSKRLSALSSAVKKCDSYINIKRRTSTDQWLSNLYETTEHYMIMLRLNSTETDLAN